MVLNWYTAPSRIILEVLRGFAICLNDCGALITICDRGPSVSGTYRRQNVHGKISHCPTGHPFRWARTIDSDLSPYPNIYNCKIFLYVLICTTFFAQCNRMLVSCKNNNKENPCGKISNIYVQASYWTV